MDVLALDQFGKGVRGALEAEVVSPLKIFGCFRKSHTIFTNFFGVHSLVPLLNRKPWTGNQSSKGDWNANSHSWELGFEHYSCGLWRVGDRRVGLAIRLGIAG